MQKIKTYLNLSNIIFFISAILLMGYGAYHFQISNIAVMCFVIPVILIQAIHVGKLRFDINLLFLAESFFVKAMLEQHTGRSWMVASTIAMPMLMYLFGKMLVAENRKFTHDFGPYFRTHVALIALTIGAVFLALSNINAAKGTEFEGSGVFPIAFAKEATYVTQPTQDFYIYFGVIFWVMIVCAVLWASLEIGKNKIKRIKYFIIVGIFALGFVFVLLYSYKTSQSFQAFELGVKLICTKHWGNFGNDLFEFGNTTCNMWLDYGRDFGIMVFVTLFIFFLLTIKDAVLLLRNQHVNLFTKAWLLLLFCYMNYYYFTDSTAYTHPVLWYIGLVINGIISEISKTEIEMVKKKKEKTSLEKEYEILGEIGVDVNSKEFKEEFNKYKDSILGNWLCVEHYNSKDRAKDIIDTFVAGLEINGAKFTAQKRKEIVKELSKINQDNREEFTEQNNCYELFDGFIQIITTVYVVWKGLNFLFRGGNPDELNWENLVGIAGLLIMISLPRLLKHFPKQNKELFFFLYSKAETLISVMSGLVLFICFMMLILYKYAYHSWRFGKVVCGIVIVFPLGCMLFGIVNMMISQKKLMKQERERK